MQNEFQLSSKNSNRVTYAAVFLPSAANPDQDIKYLLPKGIRGASGFEEYSKDMHHRDTGMGVLCCGNCYEQGKVVPVHHRKATDERIAGGDQQGTDATFSAFPNTLADHTKDCNDRRSAAGRAAQKHNIKFHINIPETYHGDRPPESATDTRLNGRKPIAIHTDLQELLVPLSHMSRDQAQDAMYVVDGQASSHRRMLIDGDNWKGMTTGEFDKKLYRIFHVTNPVSSPLRDFVNATVNGPDGVTKISCSAYEFTDGKGRRHVVQPVLHTTRDDVLVLFERSGDFLVLAASSQTKTEMRGKTIHEVVIYANHAPLVAELYKDPTRKIADYNAVHNLQLTANDVHQVQPKVRHASVQKAPLIPAGQTGLFGNLVEIQQALAFQ